jgi:hypothetical protein
VRYLGEIDNSPDAVKKLVAKVSRQYAAQRGQAEVCCHVMNADVWPHSEAHISRYQTASEGRKESNSSTT